MPSPSKGPRLGGGPAHERLMLANLATALFEHGKITTTEAKAKRLRPLAERLVTFAKRGDLSSRRRAMTVIRDKGVVHVLFTEIGPRYENRQGGYTRITKVGPRKGDNAPMAVIELVEELDESKKKTRATKPKKAAAKKTTAKKSTAKKSAAAATGAEETVADSPDDEAAVEAELSEGAPVTPADDAAVDESPTADAATDDAADEVVDESTEAEVKES